MKFGNFVLFLFLIYETSFYLVTGKTSEEKNDCTKLYNLVRGDNKVYSLTDCCLESGVKCENGYITKLEL